MPELKPLVISDLKPPLNATLIQGAEGLKELSQWLSAQSDKAVGVDAESNITVDFWHRRARTLQIGSKDKQFVVDFLAFAGSEEALVESQGYYGKNNGALYAPIFNVLSPVLCSAAWTKVGTFLHFDCELLKWNFGVRMWNLFSCDLAERIIQAGRLSLKKYAEFSMEAMAARYFRVQIDKTEQSGFDLKTPLTQSQIEYAAFDVRMPLAIRQAQLRVLTVDQLLATTTIENDAIPAYVDMSLNGQNLDDARWLKRIEETKAQRIEYLKVLDEAFIPVVGTKTTAVDYNELDRLEGIWRNNFELPTADEQETATAIRLEKDKEKKEALRTILKNQKQLRAQKKAEARAAFSALSKVRTKYLKIIEKCEGEAFLNYGSNQQLLEALHHFPGMRSIESVGDDVLIKFNDRPLIQILRKYRKGKKDTGTYGEQWTQRWITKPCKAEGWRHPGDGRLHCQFNQLEAETGRSSSSKPNAQNLPKDDEVRACFIASPADKDEPEGYVIVTCDMSGAELRIIAELAQAQSWLKAFSKGQDVHSVSTEILYPEKWPSLTEEGCAYFKVGTDGQPERQKCHCKGHKELRDNTKAVNFLLCYGGGPDALADEISVSLDTAKELMRLHEQKFPEVWAFLFRSGEAAKRNGEARDMYGRRRLFIEPTYELAREWVIDNDDEKLELDEEACDAALFTFKAKELREPNESEKWSLTHRAPTDKEIKQGMRAMIGSIGRKGKNHGVQGTNVSLAKRVMGCGVDVNGKPYLWHLLPKYKARLLSFIHDEFVIECPKRHGQEVLDCVIDAIKRAGQEIFKYISMEAEGRVAERWMK